MKRSVVVFLLSLTGCTHRVSDAEFGALSQALLAEPGRTIADVGAGDGHVAAALSKRVGPAGAVLATELAPSLRRAISDRIRAEGLRNVTLVTASEDTPGLSPGCCDAVLMRGVYHHLTQPELTLARIVEALKPGGRLVVVDFAPTVLLAAYSGSKLRSGHGVDREAVLSEVSRAGLEAVSSIDRYPGLWPLPAYALVFRKAVAP